LRPGERKRGESIRSTREGCKFFSSEGAGGEGKLRGAWGSPAEGLTVQSTCAIKVEGKS